MPSKSAASSPVVVHPPVGTLIDNGALELVEILGVGGYGVVYRAVDTRSTLPKSYAVKCLLQSQIHGSRQRNIHIREITLHQLASAHPNVVTLHRVIEEYQRTYIIMDYASDGDLFTQILNSCRYLGDDYLIKQVFLQLLDAVEYCHSLGIYHRDLKPENVLCFDGGLRVAITDFGLATTDKFSEEFRTGSVYHMSPECQGGAFAPTGSYSPMFNDIWSLAIILLNLATGRNPWKSACASDPTFQAYLRDPTGFLPTVLPISSEINAVLVRMLEVDWRDRMTLRELREAIEDIDNFYSDGVVFEGSMARCPWEAGMDIDSESSTKAPQEDSTRADLQSRWSKDSLSDSDIMFASESTADESFYGRWADYSSAAATWGFESGLLCDSPDVLSDLKLFDTPRTSPSTQSTMSHSRSGSTPSLPNTPQSVDMTFTGRMDPPPKTLTIDTECCRTRYLDNSHSMASSLGSSMMQTAIDYDIYSTSPFFLTSAAPTSKPSINMPSTVDLGRMTESEDKEMNDLSNWDYSVGDFSIYSPARSSIISRIECDTEDCTSPTPDASIWTEIRSQPIPIPQPRLPRIDFHSLSDSLSPSAAAISSPKKSHERPKGPSIFKFFPRSPHSSSSARHQFQSDSTSPSRTPSPLPSAWSTFSSPKSALAPLGTQNGGCRRTARRSGKHWFSPGKLFSTAA